MHGTIQSTLRNILLAKLSSADFSALSPHLEPVELLCGQILVQPGVRTAHAWFPDCGIGSITILSPAGHRVEAGVFGRDAMTPAPLVLGIDAIPYQIFIQMAGRGHRIAAGVLMAAIDQSPGLRAVLGCYLQTLGTQIAFTALSNAVHQIDKRCARWLLMVHDRVDGDDIKLTHEFLSLMLAVRRPSVTTALHILEGERLIRAERGWITIRDRAALEAFADDAYGGSEIEYRQLIGPMN